MAISPMMKHYLETKEKYPNTILFYRLGDFYELFFDDAILCSRELDLTLTGKDCGLEERAPMCGMPYHSVESYIAKLINNGHKVAICEQLSLPEKGKKIVERDVIRIITPGTVIDSAILNDSANYIACVYKQKNNIGFSYLDISTGEFSLSEFSGDKCISTLNDVLSMIKPSEIICNEEILKYSHDLPSVKGKYCAGFEQIDEENFDYSNCENLLKNQFNVNSLKAFNCSSKMFAIASAGALLNYVLNTQKRSLSHINKLNYVTFDLYMQLDANTRRNLELTENSRDRKKHGSLYWLLDKTRTKMGSRLLKLFIEQPLYNEEQINARLKGVEELTKNIIAREDLSGLLYNVYDIERLCGKVSYGNITPKDCVALKNSLSLLPQISNTISGFKSKIINQINNDIFDFSDITDLLTRAFNDVTANTLKDGGFIKQGYNAELDELNNISSSAKKWMAELEAKEKERTGIKNLKISYNKVFGYYIEVSNSQKGLVPYNYIRKQTLTTGERFITEELKVVEDKVLHAEERKSKLEQMIFDEIRNFLLNKIESMQTTARAIALLDVLYSLATVATERNYVKPIVTKENHNIEIIGGRHPIVESIMKDEDFVANDTILNTTDSRTMIITGPNMAGKSTYMRQVAIITLMAHIGSFVPATSAKIALTDKIFTRVGASDDLAFGQSTFMVEMNEVSYILSNATNNSLIVLDEVGRGTSTFDGLSIAWSVMEYLSANLRSKTLFATHYHELTELEGVLEGVKNYRISVKEFNNSIIFLRKIVRGGANRSFGIEVASMAGLPESVVSRAKEILHSLEQNDVNRNIAVKNANTNEALTDKRQTKEIMAVLHDLDLNTLTPLNAFDVLVQLKNYIKEK